MASDLIPEGIRLAVRDAMGGNGALLRQGDREQVPRARVSPVRSIWPCRAHKFIRL